MDENKDSMENVKDVSREPKKVGFSINNKWHVAGGIALVVAMLIAGIVYFYRDSFVVAKVNGQWISRLDLLSELETRHGDDMVEDLIVRKLVEQEAEREGIVVTEAEINEEVSSLETEIQLQGISLDDALGMEGITRKEFRNQIRLQKIVEKLLSDKIAITDEEVDEYIKEYELASEDMSEEETVQLKAQINEQLRQQNFGMEVQALIERLKEEADITYYRNS